MLEGLITGKTYNVNLVDILGDKGLDLKVMFLEEIAGFNTAIGIKDVHTTFFDFAEKNDIDLLTSRYYVFIDIDGEKFPILEEYIASFDTADVPANITIYDASSDDIKSATDALKSLGLRFKVVV